jgi:DNA (cytosine-5)-methyltransferase 1
MDLNSNITAPKIVSLFSGCGGLDLGFHLEGYDTIWANDFSEWAVSSFRNYFGDVITLGDITQVDPYMLTSCNLSD